MVKEITEVWVSLEPKSAATTPFGQMAVYFKCLIVNFTFRIPNLTKELFCLIHNDDG